MTSPIIYQKPNEKTLVEEPVAVEEAPVEVLVEEKILVAAEEEKVLVETPTTFSMLDYKLNLSDDFSSLVTQFKQLTVSPVEATPKKREPTIKQIVEPVLISASDSSTSQPQPQNRRNSVSSKKSQKSTKSVKSAKSFKSARKHVNKQQRPKEKPKYIPRTYDEMMRIPDIYERISFYDKTLDLCLKAESPITKWSSTTLKKGKPQAVVDGYSRDLLSGSTSCLFSPDDSIKNASTTFGSSISLFLKKATSTQSFQQPLQQKSSSPYPQTSHGLFGRSMSRFQLSRSTQLPPKHDRILLNNRVAHTKPRNLSPLSTLPPIQTSASTPTKVHDGLAYMMNILPQIDVKILQSALDEAHGDPMEAITLAVSKNKSSSMLSHDTVPRKKKHMKKTR